jgi:hypothetical protein
LPQVNQETISHDPLLQIVGTTNPKSQPCYLQLNYNQAEISVDHDGGVTGGTVPALSSTDLSIKLDEARSHKLVRFSAAPSALEAGNVDLLLDDPR